MKTYMRPIKMEYWSDEKGLVTPLVFRWKTDEGEYIYIKVEVRERSEERFTGNKMLVYKCQSVIDGTEKIYELKYELSSCKWFLSKM